MSVQGLPEKYNSNLPEVSLEILPFTKHESLPSTSEAPIKRKMALYGHGQPIAQFTNKTVCRIFEQFGHYISFLLYPKFHILFIEYESLEEAQKALEKANQYFRENNIMLVLQLSYNFRRDDFDSQDLSRTLFCWHPSTPGLSLSDSEVTQYFRKYGPISKISSIKKRNYFFVEFENPEDAVNALQTVEEDFRKDGYPFQIRLSAKKRIIQANYRGLPDFPSENNDPVPKKQPFRHENLTEDVQQNQRQSGFRPRCYDRYDRRPRATQELPPYGGYHGYPLESDYTYSQYPVQYAYYPVYQYEVNPQAWAYPRIYDDVCYY